MSLESQIRCFALIIGLLGVVAWFTKFDFTGPLLISVAFAVWVVSHVKSEIPEEESR